VERKKRKKGPLRAGEFRAAGTIWTFSGTIPESEARRSEREERRKFLKPITKEGLIKDGRLGDAKPKGVA